MHKELAVAIWPTRLRCSSDLEAVKLLTAQYVFLRFRSRLADRYADHLRLYEERTMIDRVLAGGTQCVGHGSVAKLAVTLRRWLEAVLAPPWPEDLEEAARKSRSVSLPS